jgi:MFS family permease
VPIIPYVLEDHIGVPKASIPIHSSSLLAAYAAASVLASPPAGIIADRLNRRQLPFLFGLAALTGATILFFTAKTVVMLSVARVLQGISGAIVWTVGLALIYDTVGSKKLGVVMGSVFTVIAIGDLIAPLIGGTVYEKTGSNGVLLLCCSILVVDFAMRLLVIEAKEAAGFGILKKCDEEEDEQEQEPNERDLLLNRKDEEAKEFHIPEGQSKWLLKIPVLYCLSNPRFLVAQLVTVMHGALFGAIDISLPLEGRDLFGFDPLKAGLLFAPFVLPYLILGPLAGKSVDKYGPKPAGVAGFLYMVPVLALLRIPHEGGKDQIIIFSTIIAFIGVGFGFIAAPSIPETSYVVEQYYKHNKEFFGNEEPFAQLYAINSMVFSTGLTVGPLLAGTLREAIGFGNMALVFSGLCLVTGVMCFFFIGGRPKILRIRRND